MGINFHKNHIGGVSLYECLRVIVVDMDAPEDKMTPNSERKTPVKTHFYRTQVSRPVRSMGLVLSN